jgi:hypothetical protein
MPKPVIHGRDHAPGGADPIPGLGGVGTAELKLFASDDWDMACPNGTTNMRWKLDETPAGNFDDYWQLYDYAADPTTAGSEFVNVGVKKWGTLTVSGFISCPTGHSASDYKRTVEGQFGGWVGVGIEVWDHRIDNVFFSGNSAPQRSGWAGGDVAYALKIQFSQVSGSTMTLAGAACNLLFVEADRT